MATYNGGQFLAEQLESLANQRLLPAELQVGDDGSTDDTLEILQEFQRRAPFPVAIHRNRANLGFGENFLQTAARCTGEWIAFCDQDDIWSPEKLQRCMEGIRSADRELMLVVHDAVVLRAFAEPELMNDLPPVGLHSRLDLPPDWMAPGFRQVFRKTLIDQAPFAGRFMSWRVGYEEAHDAWIPLLANATGSILLLGEPLVGYRRHASNTTALPSQTAQRHWSTLKATVKNNVAAYRAQANTAEQIADALQKLAPFSKEPMATLLMEAAGAIRKYSGDLRTRAEVHGKAGLVGRTHAFTTLVRSGRYLSGPWPFGMKALIKDAASALLPH